MSKSLGNVVDPLEVIDAQGADALRFTLATGTTAGQDLNLSLERLSGNRNFTNKMWNAGAYACRGRPVLSAPLLLCLPPSTTPCRFPPVPASVPGKLILLNLDALSDEERCALADVTISTDAELQALPLAERWIVSRVHDVAGQVVKALDKFDFGEVRTRLRARSWPAALRIGRAAAALAV